MTLAEKIYAELTVSAASTSILDDRDDRPGVKFKDSELVGFPIRLGIGEKSLAKGEVELKLRGGVLTPVKVRDGVAKNHGTAWLLSSERSATVSEKPVAAYWPVYENDEIHPDFFIAAALPAAGHAAPDLAGLVDTQLPSLVSTDQNLHLHPRALAL